MPNRPRWTRARRVGLLLALLTASACASVGTRGVAIRDDAGDAVATPPAAPGTPRRRVQVLRIGIPKDIADQYRELTDRRVGWGLSNRVLDGLYESGRFDFVEEKDSVLRRMADQWRRSESGLVSEQTRIAPGALTAPEYLVYAEVFDFSVTRRELVAAVATERRNTTIVGVQLRLVSVRTGEYVVASGTGDATTTAGAIWISPTIEFDQTTVGMATRRAVNGAVEQLLRRAAARGIL